MALADTTLIDLGEGLLVCDIEPLRNTLAGLTASVAKADRAARAQLRTLLSYARKSVSSCLEPFWGSPACSG